MTGNDKLSWLGFALIYVMVLIDQVRTKIKRRGRHG